MDISVIIPACNEEKNLPLLLQELRVLRPHEIIVVDGESTDHTVSLAEAGGAIVMKLKRNLAAQVNAGAKRAAGNVLWILHADSRLKNIQLSHIKNAFSSPSVMGGGFSLGIDDPHPAFRLIAFGANLRARFLNLILGDQGLFVRRQIFETLGGFDGSVILEDADFCDRLKTFGRVVILKEKIFTSSRKWCTHGIVKVTLFHWKTYLQHRLQKENQAIQKKYQNFRLSRKS